MFMKKLTLKKYKFINTHAQANSLFYTWCSFLYQRRQLTLGWNSLHMEMCVKPCFLFLIVDVMHHTES